MKVGEMAKNWKNEKEKKILSPLFAWNKRKAKKSSWLENEFNFQREEKCNTYTVDIG